MLLWVNHIDKATDRSSVVINNNGWWTAHVVVELKCCNAENAVMGGSGTKAGDKAEVERGGDTFRRKQLQNGFDLILGSSEVTDGAGG